MRQITNIDVGTCVLRTEALIGIDRMDVRE